MSQSESQLKSFADVTNSDGIYTLRTIHQHQAAMLILADQKANILIGTIAVVLTVLFTNFYSVTTINDSFLYYALGFLLLEALAMLLSLLVIMPKNNHGKIRTSMGKLSNPLYFGFFVHCSEDEFADHISENLNTNLSSRNLLARDIYQIGQILNRKYRLLKYAYLLAVMGILLLSFTVILSTFSAQV